MAVSIRFDANQLKADIADKIEGKVKGLTTNQQLYNELSEIFYTYIIKYLPKDTGALKMTGAGYAKNDKHHYYRYPAGTIGGHHGVEFDAIEERPHSLHHYAYGVMSKVFDNLDVREGVMDAMMADGSWDEFCEKAAPIIARYMNNG